MLQTKSCFSFPTPPNGRHIFIAVAEVAPGKFLCVNLTTRRKKSDGSCVLKPEDHPKITHESFINFKEAIVISIRKVNSLHRDGRCTWHNPVSDEVLEKIKDGGRKSKRLPKKFKHFMN